MAQLVEALRYKPEGSGFDLLQFITDIIHPATLRHWGHSPSNRNKYKEYSLGVKVAGA